MTSIFPVFAVPMASTQLSADAVFNAALRDLFLAHERPDYKNPSPSMEIGPALFESDFDLFSWTHDPVVKLRNLCWAYLGQVLREMNQFTAEELNAIEIKSHTWFHITRNSGRFGLHNHPMASWSGVYCVDDGAPDLTLAHNGVLRIHNPMAAMNMFLDSGNFRLQPPYAPRSLDLSLRPGDVVIFPSWLMHEVLPFHGERARITVAFNCWFGSKSA
jgi:uncharacterized protein (TIGR02466 family)